MTDMLLFGVTLTPTYLAMTAMGVVIAALGAGYLFRKDTAIEGRRREMIALCARLQGLGLERLAGFAECYAVGDYSGLYSEGKALVKQVMDADDAMGLLDKSFYIQLPKRLDREGDRPKILKVIEQYRAAHPELFAEPPASAAATTTATAAA
ncbi:MAG TPA: hypothetical protein VMY37_20525 [Thermoguttaceae bacterium]|nr:hypothetical protein [Thermoguttaceae bacterium]